MAQRYLRASGNWNGPVWAATSSGAAGSASTPSDSDDVYIAANYTVTLIDNVELRSFHQSAGTFNLSGYTVYVRLNSNCHTGNRTLNFQGGTFVAVGGIDFGNSSPSSITMDGTGSIVIGPVGTPDTWRTNSLTFNDVIINIGFRDLASTLNITGSPTFRSLTIQSKNSAAHTVNVSGDITLDKFIGIGSSHSNRLKVTDNGNLYAINFTDNATSYGQFLNMDIEPHMASNFNAPLSIPPYIGNGSISLGSLWLDQDPPKASTLIDEFTSL